MIEPSPPRRLHPPSTAAAIPYNSRAMQYDPHHGPDDNHQDKRHGNSEHASGRQFLQPFKAGAGAKPLGFVVGNESRQAPIEEQATESDDEWLNPQSRNQQ